MLGMNFQTAHIVHEEKHHVPHLVLHDSQTLQTTLDSLIFLRKADCDALKEGLFRRRFREQQVLY